MWIQEMIEARVVSSPTDQAPHRSTAQRLLKVWPDFGQSLSISRSKAFALCAAGEVRTVRIGRSVRVPVEEVDRYIASRLAESAA